MAHGGARKGAGRPKGRANRMNEEARAKVAAEGITPLDYLLSLLRDAQMTREVRTDAAKAAAPYVHARLAAVEHSGSIAGRGATDVTDDELANIAAGGSEGTAEAPIDKTQLN